eukprot:COSAG06_NODE_8114_length_2270_cov_1.963151_2_plen_712_part_01
MTADDWITLDQRRDQSCSEPGRELSYDIQNSQLVDEYAAYRWQISETIFSAALSTSFLSDSQVDRLGGAAGLGPTVALQAIQVYGDSEGGFLVDVYAWDDVSHGGPHSWVAGDRRPGFWYKSWTRPVSTPCTAPGAQIADLAGSIDFVDGHLHNDNCSWTITCPLTGGSPVLLFTAFDIEENRDYVRVFSGADANGGSSAQLAELTGAGSPGPYIASSHSMHVQFNADGSIDSGGFRAHYHCHGALQGLLSSDAYTLPGHTGHVQTGQFEAAPDYPNRKESNVPGVGSWGGTCTCPNGQVYQVGDNKDSCSSLACVNGVSGDCNQTNPGGDGVRVTCDFEAMENITTTAIELSGIFQADRTGPHVFEITSELESGLWIAQHEKGALDAGPVAVNSNAVSVGSHGEASRTYSNSFCDTGLGRCTPYQWTTLSTLDSPGCWASCSQFGDFCVNLDTQPWLQIDLGAVKSVAGVITQAGCEANNGEFTAAYVGQFTVSYALDFAAPTVLCREFTEQQQCSQDHCAWEADEYESGTMPAPMTLGLEVVAYSRAGWNITVGDSTGTIWKHIPATNEIQMSAGHWHGEPPVECLDGQCPAGTEYTLRRPARCDEKPCVDITVAESCLDTGRCAWQTRCEDNFVAVPGTFTGELGDNYTYAIFPEAITARFVRINMLQWGGNSLAVIRADVVLKDWGDGAYFGTAAGPQARIEERTTEF